MAEIAESAASLPPAWRLNRYLGQRFVALSRSHGGTVVQWKITGFRREIHGFDSQNITIFWYFIPTCETLFKSYLWLEGLFLASSWTEMSP